MKKPRYCLPARFAFWVKCLEFPLDPQLHSLRVSPFHEAFFFVMYEMARLACDMTYLVNWKD